MKAMLLAAGRGKRMMPLTEHMPKPLLKVRGKSLIEYHLENLSRAGVREVVVNVNYFASQLIERLGNGEQFGVELTFSHEENQLLGTGGGIKKALPLLGEEPFIVVSADIWSDYPFARLLRQPFADDVHLVMVDNPAFHPLGDYGIQQGRLVSTPPKKTYGNIALIHPRLFHGETREVFSLAERFAVAIQQERASAELYQGVWQNVGTPELLRALQATE